MVAWTFNDLIIGAIENMQEFGIEAVAKTDGYSCVVKYRVIRWPGQYPALACAPPLERKAATVALGVLLVSKCF